MVIHPYLKMLTAQFKSEEGAQLRWNMQFVKDLVLRGVEP
jgi:hypothetical protein